VASTALSLAGVLRLFSSETSFCEIDLRCPVFLEQQHMLSREFWTVGAAIRRREHAVTHSCSPLAAIKHDAIDLAAPLTVNMPKILGHDLSRNIFVMYAIIADDRFGNLTSEVLKEN
jgi:hypothetical protein